MIKHDQEIQCSEGRHDSTTHCLFKHWQIEKTGNGYFQLENHAVQYSGHTQKQKGSNIIFIVRKDRARTILEDNAGND